MIDLNHYKYNDIKKMGRELGLSLSGKKDDIIRKFNNSGIPEEKILSVAKNYTPLKSAAKRSSKISRSSKSGMAKKISEFPLESILTKIGNLEKRMDYLMKKVDKMELTMANPSHFEPEFDIHDIENIKISIRNYIPKGNSASIDEITKLKSLKKYSWNKINQAILEMIDEEVFDCSEGRSKRKIENNIGRIIRR